MASAAPLVVDLCTGSGAIALAVAPRGARGAAVHAVELRPGALGWAGATSTARARPATRSTCGRRLRRPALPELDGTVDVVVSNPPYIPTGARTSRPEVATTTRRSRCRRGDGRAGRRSAASSAPPPRLLRPGRAGRRRARRPARASALPARLRGDRRLARRRRPRATWPAAPRYVTARPATALDGRAVTRLLSRERRYDCTDPTQRRGRPRRRRGARSAAASWSCCRPTPSTASAPTPSPRRRSRAARGQGPRPRHARAGAGRLPRTLDGLVDDVPAGRARPGRGVLAGRADRSCSSTSRRWPGTSARPGHGRRADAAAPGRARAAARDRPDGGLQRQPHRPARRPRPRRGRRAARRRPSPSTSTAGRAGGPVPSTIVDSPATPAVLRVGAIGVDRLREVAPDLTDAEADASGPRGPAGAARRRGAERR